MPTPRNTSRRRLLCAEPLEGRRLFSAPTVSPAPPPSPAATGTVDKLPDALLETLRSRFGQVTILSAEFTTDDGDREWDVTAESPELSIDATLSPAGALLEAETVRRAAPPADPAPKPAAASLAIQSPDATAPSLSAPTPADRVEVVAVKPADLADTDRPLNPRRLPPAVAAAMAALFPGATVREAEFSDDDDGPEVGIHGEFEGRAIDLAFTTDGRLKESQDALTADELPQAVRDWVRSQFPAATISDAAAVTAAGVVSYEMQVNPPAARPLEVALRLPPASSPAGPSVEGAGRRSGPGRNVPGTQASLQSVVIPLQPRHSSGHGESAGIPVGANVPSVPGRSEDAANSEVAANNRTREDGSAGLLVGTAPLRATRGATESLTAAARTALAAAANQLHALAAFVASGRVAPALAAVMPALLTADLAQFERALDEWLRKFGSGAGSRDGAAAAPATVAARVVAAAALVAAAHLVLVDVRRRRGTPALAFDLSAGTPRPGRRPLRARRAVRRR